MYVIEVGVGQGFQETHNQHRFEATSCCGQEIRKQKIIYLLYSITTIVKNMNFPSYATELWEECKKKYRQTDDIVEKS